jgi:hypothetical protein
MRRKRRMALAAVSDQPVASKRAPLFSLIVVDIDEAASETGNRGRRKRRKAAVKKGHATVVLY